MASVGNLKVGTHRSSKATYVGVKQKLECLGYFEYLSEESSQLVKKLLEDLETLSEIKQDTFAKCSHLEKLNSELSLHLNKCTVEKEKLLNQVRFYKIHDKEEKDNWEKQAKELSRKIVTLEEKNEDLDFLAKKQATTLVAYEEILRQLPHSKPDLTEAHRLIHLMFKSKAALSSKDQFYDRLLKSLDGDQASRIVDQVESHVSDQEDRMRELKRELKATRLMLENYKAKVWHLEDRLSSLPSKSLQDNKPNSCMVAELEHLKRQNDELKRQLSAAIDSQHEAMKRAISLASPESKRKTATSFKQVPSAGDHRREMTSLLNEISVLKSQLKASEHEQKLLQREKDSLLDKMKAMASQEGDLMVEIKNLVSNMRKPFGLPNAGPEAAARSDTSHLEELLALMNQHRQEYYNNVVQLKQLMQSRQEKVRVAFNPPSVPLVISQQSTQTKTPTLKTQSVQATLTEEQPQQRSLRREEDLMNVAPLQLTKLLQDLLQEKEALKSRVELLERDLKVSEVNVAKLCLDKDQANSKCETYTNKISNSEKENRRLLDKLSATERELIMEKSQHQHLQLQVEERESVLADLRTKLAEKENQYEQSQRTKADLEEQVRHWQATVSSLQSNLQMTDSNKQYLEAEKLRFMKDLEMAQEKMASREKELFEKQQDVFKEQQNLQVLQSQLRQTQDNEARKGLELEAIQRQVSRLSVELKTSQSEAEALLRENRRLLDQMAEAKADVQRTQRETEQLRSQMQEYVDRVKHIENLLARKEHDQEELLKQFHHLSAEANSQDTQRAQLERTMQSNLDEIEKLQGEISRLRRRTSELEILYSEQRTLRKEAEAQAQEAAHRIAFLESTLNDTQQDRIRVGNQLEAARDLHQQLEKQLERLRSEAAVKDTQNSQMDGEMERLKDDLRILQQRVTLEKESTHSLEALVVSLRQERMAKEAELEQVQGEIHRAQGREQELLRDLMAARAELRLEQGQVADLELECRRLRQSITNERFEKERTKQELKRYMSTSRSIVTYESFGATQERTELSANQTQPSKVASVNLLYSSAHDSDDNQSEGKSSVGKGNGKSTVAERLFQSPSKTPPLS